MTLILPVFLFFTTGTRWGELLDYAYYYNVSEQTIFSNSVIIFDNPIRNSIGIQYSSGNILLINTKLYLKIHLLLSEMYTRKKSVVSKRKM